jgi:hypothetical protein
VTVIDFPGSQGEYSADSIPESERQAPPHDRAEYVRFEPETGMHITNSVDLVLILEGEIELSAEVGDPVTLQVGDIVVQRGAMHAWRLPEAGCRLAFIMLGAAHT